MLTTLFNIHRTTPFILACSGGVDSMAAADFYKKGGKDFELAYFHHGTSQADEMKKLVVDWGKENDICVNVGHIENANKPAGLSPEEYWRNERYKYLFSVAGHKPIITCHHLNDVCETWIFSALNGNPKIIAPVVPSSSSLNNSILRPFLTTTKQNMIDWCIVNNVKWFEDKSNEDVNTPRNRIRHNIMKEALLINPGLSKVMRKKVIAYYEKNK